MLDSWCDTAKQDQCGISLLTARLSPEVGTVLPGQLPEAQQYVNNGLLGCFEGFWVIILPTFGQVSRACQPSFRQRKGMHHHMQCVCMVSAKLAESQSCKAATAEEC